MSTDGPDHGGLPPPPPPGQWPEGYLRVILPETDSTMAEARRRLPDLKGPTWILAHRQTAARGRQGRTWLQAKGNFAGTLIYRPWASPSEAAKRSFMAANALFETLALYVERSALALKWPNDVLLRGGKVAGILLESQGTGQGIVDFLAIGIGVNLRHAPADIQGPFPPISLTGAGGHEVGPDEFLTSLASNFATQEAKLEAFGFVRIRDDWLSHAAKLGETITARTPRENVTGIFETVDMDGNLILMTPTGQRIISAAEVHF